MVDYNIISTGSHGNAVVIGKHILIDCGVPYKLLRPYVRDLKLILLTHIHSDHFNRSTIRNLAKERPTLRFGCGRWLVAPLVELGVSKTNIDVLDFDKLYGYGICNVIPIPLVHNVPNCGYKLHFASGGKIIYATDTNNLNGIRAYHYDLYLIEANYEDDIIMEKIKEKKANGEYAYEMQVIKNHLSKAKCDNFIYSNIGPNGTYVYMHQHRDKGDTNGENYDSEDNQV